VAEDRPVPVAPSLEPALAIAHMTHPLRGIGVRTLVVAGLAGVLGAAAALIAQGLLLLIALVTNLAWFGRLSLDVAASPAHNALGLVGALVPAAGGLVVGMMARFGSPAIRGHGIPEAMERVLLHRSRVPPRLTVLKPASAAIAIGTGGPFGAEGPIIATGGALGSFLGQLLAVTADERKTLLAAGAAAGMAATFGTPVAAVLLAVELLLFEYRPRSLIPVALASVAATAVRGAIVGSAPMFAMPALARPEAGALVAYVVLGALLGLLAVALTRAVYAIEDLFEHLPIHWMWWPALGGLVVGVVGLWAPRTLGVGYDNIDAVLRGELTGMALVGLALWKSVSWLVALGSGTSGGTLAPLFTIGGSLGAALASAVALALPGLGVDVRLAGLVGMAATFAGASHALLASVVFAFETTQQPLGLVPLLGSCAAAYLVSLACMRTSIMTEKLARRGTHLPDGYASDYLATIAVRAAMQAPVVTLAADAPIAEVRARLATDADLRHQGFPVLDAGGRLIGVVTRRDLQGGAADGRRVGDVVHRPPLVVGPQQTLRDAADRMVRADVGRLPVIDPAEPTRVIGILTRSDLLAAHARRLDEAHRRERRRRLAPRRVRVRVG
jgi:CIC family chloride channel protein